MPAAGSFQERNFAAEVGPVLPLQDVGEKLAFFTIEAKLDGTAGLKPAISLDRNEQRIEAGFLSGRVADDHTLDALPALDLQRGAMTWLVLRAVPVGDDAL